MVKGISRRVVVVDSPDQRFFEQAIFIVRNDAGRRGRHRPGAGGGGPPGGAKLCRRRPWRFSRIWRDLSPAVYTLMGAAGIGLVWLTVWLI